MSLPPINLLTQTGEKLNRPDSSKPEVLPELGKVEESEKQVLPVNSSVQENTELTAETAELSPESNLSAPSVQAGVINSSIVRVAPIEESKIDVKNETDLAKLENKLFGESVKS